MNLIKKQLSLDISRRNLENEICYVCLSDDKIKDKADLERSSFLTAIPKALRLFAI
jgi:hypothetical protein